MCHGYVYRRYDQCVRACETERKSGFRKSTRSCRALTTTGCCCCWRSPPLTGAQDGRHRLVARVRAASFRASSSPSDGPAVPCTSRAPLLRIPRVPVEFFLFSPDDSADIGRTACPLQRARGTTPALASARRAEPRHAGAPSQAFALTSLDRGTNREAHACVPEYRYADRRVALREAPEIPRPSRARSTVRIAAPMPTTFVSCFESSTLVFFFFTFLHLQFLSCDRVCGFSVDELLLWKVIVERFDSIF